MQLSIGFAKDDRAQSEIGAGDDSQRHRRPKQQRAPRPKPGDDTDDDQRAEGVVRTDASIRDNWKVRLRFANEIDAGNAESEAGYDVHQVMLISKERRKTDEVEPESFEKRCGAMEGGCRAGPFRGTNRKRFQTTHWHAGAQRRNAEEKEGNRFRPHRWRRRCVWTMWTVPARRGKGMAPRQRRGRSTCRARS